MEKINYKKMESPKADFPHHKLERTRPLTSTEKELDWNPVED